MNVKLSIVSILIILSIGASGCSLRLRSFGLEPVKPYSTFGVEASVDSLQPEFQWNASKVGGTTYDFAVWKPNPKSQSRGELVYEVENLNVNHHVIEKPLLPDTVYCWSVRERRDKDNYVGHWSSYVRYRWMVVMWAIQENMPFYFKTPKSAKLP
jgi:hypothetical protein